MLLIRSALRPLLLVLLAGCVSEPAASRSQQALSSTAPVGAELQLSSAGSVPSHPGLQFVAAASGGGVHLSAWSGGAFLVPYAARVRSSDGALLDATHIQLTKGRDPCGRIDRRPAVGYANGTFLVVWPTSSWLCGVRVRPDGTVLDSPALILARSRADAPAVTSDGTNFFLVWVDGRVDSSHGGADIYGARVRASDGAPLDGDGFAIASGPQPEWTPAVAFDGTNYLAVWAIPPGASTGVYGARIRASDRQILDTTPIAFETQESGPGTVAYDGSTFTVVWTRWPQLRFQQVRADGTLVRPPASVLYSGDVGNEPVIASDGTNQLVVFRGTQLQARRFDRAGAPVGSPLVLDPAPGSAYSWTDQAVTFTDGKFFVAWDRATGVQPDELNRNPMQIRGASIDATTGVAAPDLSLANQAPRQHYPTASFDGQQHLVVWHEWTGRRHQVRGARLRDSDGALLDPAGFDLSASGTKNQLFAQTASNGSNHLVIWWEGDKLRARRVRGSDGALLDDPPLTLPGTPGANSQDAPRFTVASDGQDYMVMWTEGDSGAFNSVRTLVARVRGSDGVVLDQTPVAIQPSKPGILSPALGFAGTSYLAAWVDNGSITARRVSRAGAVVGDAFTLGSSPTVGVIRVAALGDTAMVLWNFSGVRGRRVRTSDGALLDPAPFTVSPSAYYNSYATLLSAAQDGEHLVALWAHWLGATPSTGGAIRLGRITSGGALLDPGGVVAAGDPDNDTFDPAVSASPGGHVLTAYVRFDPDPARASDRLRFRWFGKPFPAQPAPDAAVPADSAAAAPDAAVVAPDAAAPDATAAAPEAGVVDAGVSDGAAPAGDAALAEAGPALDSSAGGVPADAAADQAVAPLDAGVADGGSPDGRASALDGSAGGGPGDAGADAGSRDGATDGTGTTPPSGCDCRLAGPRESSLALPALLGAAILGLFRRRRARR